MLGTILGTEDLRARAHAGSNTRVRGRRRALRDVRAVGFASTGAGVVSSAKRGVREKPGKALRREETGEPDLERGQTGALW